MIKKCIVCNSAFNTNNKSLFCNEPHFKNCKKCANPFFINARNKDTKYCKEERIFNCIVCKNDFKRNCAFNFKLICSRKCKRAIYTKKKRYNNKCSVCHKDFEATNSTKKNCHGKSKRECTVCKTSFTIECKSTKMYCTAKCKKEASRKNEIKKPSGIIMLCSVCKNSFLSINKRKYCNNHAFYCSYCDEELSIRTCDAIKKLNEQSNLFCDNTCHGFFQSKKPLDKEKLKEFKNQEEWAIHFKNENGGFPSKNEFLIYFDLAKTTAPHKSALEYIQTKRGSRFEEIVYQYLTSIYSGEILRNKKIVPSSRNSKLEIDIILTELNIGFEIQDFKTHSKDSDSEIGVFGRIKNGPTNHSFKRESSLKSLGIKIIEIWEDEIKDSSYKKIIDETLNSKS